MVRTAGLEPATSKRDRFSSQLQFSLPPFGVCGLDFLFNIVTKLNLSCCPSSLYTFLQRKQKAWHGIAILEVSPFLSSSTPTFSRRALKFSFLSLLCIPIPPRPQLKNYKAYFYAFCNLSWVDFVKIKYFLIVYIGHLVVKNLVYIVSY